MKNIEEIIQQVESLPQLPDTAVKLMRLMGDPRSTVDDIVETIKYDQVVTTQVLKLCNSAYFGLSRKVTSLNDAMLCLGTIKLLQMVMSVHTNSMLTKKQDGYGLQSGSLWKHSVAVGIASSLIAQKLNVADVNLVFTAGLLHDIGKVVMDQYVDHDFNELQKLVTEENMSFTEAEERIIGFSHNEVGALIAEKWNLPDAIVRCIRYHHSPWELQQPDTNVNIVYLADCICLLLGIGLGEDGLSYRADQSVMERHGLHESDIEIIGVQMVTELKRVESLFEDNAETHQQPEPVR